MGSAYRLTERNICQKLNENLSKFKRYGAERKSKSKSNDLDLECVDIDIDIDIEDLFYVEYTYNK